MTINYVQSASKDKPTKIDVSSSKSGVYVRRNIKFNDEKELWTYEEAFMSFDEWEEYEMEILAKVLNEEDDSAEFEEYAKKLRTGVEYTNGKFYKPIWHKIYSEIIDEFEPKINLFVLLGGDISEFTSIKTPVYDITGKRENAEIMSILEAIKLWKFLYLKKEEFYTEYKAAKEEADKVEE